jgi:hypothetical protein
MLDIHAKTHTSGDQLMRVFEAHEVKLTAAGFCDKSRILVGFSHPLGDDDQFFRLIKRLAWAVASTRYSSLEYMQAWVFDAPVEQQTKRLAWGHKKVGMGEEWPTYALIMNTGRSASYLTIPARMQGSIKHRGQVLGLDVPVPCHLEICRLSELTSAYVAMDWCTSVEASTDQRIRIFSASGLIHELAASAKNADLAKRLVPPDLLH